MSMQPPPLDYHAPSRDTDLEYEGLAIGSLRALGFLCMAFGYGCGGLTLLSVDVRSGHGSITQWISVAFPLFVGTLGLGYWICAFRIRKGSRQAGVVAMMLAGCNLGLIFLVLSVAVVEAFRNQVNLLALGIPAILVLGLAQLIYYLYRFVYPRRR